MGLGEVLSKKVQRPLFVLGRYAREEIENRIRILPIVLLSRTSRKIRLEDNIAAMELLTTRELFADCLTTILI